MWVPPEVSDPVCLHAPTRKSVSFFGAVRLRDGKLVISQPNGMFDAVTCWAFLRKLERVSRTCAANLHAGNPAALKLLQYRRTLHLMPFPSTVRSFHPLSQQLTTHL